jgi:hypothetical protein
MSVQFTIEPPQMSTNPTVMFRSEMGSTTAPDGTLASLSTTSLVFHDETVTRGCSSSILSNNMCLDPSKTYFEQLIYE